MKLAIALEGLSGKSEIKVLGGLFCCGCVRKGDEIVFEQRNEQFFWWYYVRKEDKTIMELRNERFYKML